MTNSNGSDEFHPGSVGGPGYKCSHFPNDDRTLTDAVCVKKEHLANSNISGAGVANYQMKDSEILVTYARNASFVPMGDAFAAVNNDPRFGYFKPAQSPDNCELACMQNSDCDSWIYAPSPQTCWLKSGDGERSDFGGYTAGRIVDYSSRN